MASTNKKVSAIHTHEGGIASRTSPLNELRRSVLACMLFEGTFYESGTDIATRIQDLSKKVTAEQLSALAIEARTVYRIRHASLWLVIAMIKHHQGKIVADTIYAVIQRADELTELVAMYWKDGKQPLSAQMKKGLARAFTKFDEYSLAKYNRENAVKLRDVLFLCHAKPKNKMQESLWKRLIDNTMAIPNTWETRLSAGEDKRATFESLLQTNELGYMALLRNLRNMVDAGVSHRTLHTALLRGAPASKALPFRFVAAAKSCPSMESALNAAMAVSMQSMERLAGTTLLIIDVSGSMSDPLSEKSQMRRVDAAGALAALVCTISEHIRVFAFGTTWKEIPARADLSMIDALLNIHVGHSTNLGATVKDIHGLVPEYDRIICITDEQSRDSLPAAKGLGYIINVAPYQNGVGYDSWVHINGFSEAVVKYIQVLEEQS